MPNDRLTALLQTGSGRSGQRVVLIGQHQPSTAAHRAFAVGRNAADTQGLTTRTSGHGLGVDPHSFVTAHGLPSHWHGLATSRRRVGVHADGLDISARGVGGGGGRGRTARCSASVPPYRLGPLLAEALTGPR
ncbi:hypothetical protein, partial [Actinomadura sp. BRA 177]|uniref:hypothetical protein n=1 Tax=Actinomadura sp. BRA 177 TaxID=2745202 RepID=UPI0020CFE00E